MSATVKWCAVVTGEGRIEFRVGRDGDDVVAEWPGYATLRCARDGSRSSLAFEPLALPRWREKLERGLARAMIGQLQGKLTLHASAVEQEGRAVLLVGSSGSGKSTLAATLLRRTNARLLSDDASPVIWSDGKVFVEPSDSELWLWQEARRALRLADDAAGKAPVSAVSVATAPVPIAALVVLRFGDVATPELARMRGHDSLEALVASVVRLVVDEPAVQLREIADLERLVQAAPIFELVRPRDLRALEASAAMIDRALSTEPT